MKKENVTISQKAFMFQIYTVPMSAITDDNPQNIEDVWDEHLKCEFETHDVEGAMNTMIKEPYVHDVPVPTGGIGHDGVYDFYKNHFIGKTPTASILLYTYATTTCGILFGIGFRSVSRALREHSHVRDYMVIAAYGFVLFINAAQATVLQAGYPPMAWQTSH